ncbi:putative transcriptional regulatory protein pdtaR [Aquimixticola soesokkakensis]|uniref:Putative transcriptional regulatory protein pdtaR n=1 Tax=Aquimixticola soesokkakensis TaxID=1519096 RepID=A0A1Y5RWI6_9RHOB|nr:response regulator [Aquimixticola soesokkakensis]SLN24513.1 putative transcriptional regulatory protein pdtaR [Aquimixticola soesokkakensis]
MTQTDMTETTDVHRDILIVEDEAIVALDLKFIVEDMGLGTIGPCPTVRQGLREANANCPDIAILDVNLLDGEVYALADVLRDQHVPLIFHSAHADPVELAKRYPGAAFCPKPTTPYQIEDCVKAALSRLQ